MAILTIGRVGLDVALPNPQSFSEDRGDDGQVTLAITGQIKDTTTWAQAAVLKEELLAQVGIIVPVTYTTDASIDGFYKLLSANIDTDRKFSPYANYLLPFTVSLRRIDSPTWEMVYSGSVLPNAHSIVATANKGIVGIPSTHTWVADPSGTVSTNTLSAEGDDPRIYYALDSGDSGPEYAITPGDFYDAAAAIWINGYLRAGANRRLPAFTSAYLTNGLIKVTIAANGDIDFGYYASSAWQTALNYNIRWDGCANENGSWVDAFIVRNDPEEVCVQFLKPRATIGYLCMTVTIRRGWRMAAIDLFTDGAIDCGINRSASDAGTELSTGGNVYGIVDSSGTHKYIILTPQANARVTLTTTAGIESTGNAGRIFLGVGIIVNAAAPDTGAAQADLVDQFFNWLEVRQVCREMVV